MAFRHKGFIWPKSLRVIGEVGKVGSAIPSEGLFNNVRFEIYYIKF